MCIASDRISNLLLTATVVSSAQINLTLCLLDPHVNTVCDMESPVKVNVGENVTIQCKASPDSHYRWTKVTETLVGFPLQICVKLKRYFLKC